MSTEVTAHRLKALMREKNWGVKAFANRIPADKNSVKTWLSGEYLPRYDSLVKLCDLLDVSADYVVGLSDERGGGLRLGVPLNNLKACYVERVRGAYFRQGRFCGKIRRNDGRENGYR